MNMSTNTIHYFAHGATGVRVTNRHSPFPGWILLLSWIVFAPAAASAAPDQTGNNVGAKNPGIADSRWLPWIGTWQLIQDTGSAAGEESNKKPLLAITPKEDGKAVAIQALQDDKILFEDTVTADGVSRPLKEENCTGWYRYSWSDNGERLLFESESNCPEQMPRKISGLSFLNRKGEWLDIQLIQNQGDRVITIRRYRPLSKPAVAQDVGAEGTAGYRFVAGNSFSINEIIELSRKVPSEVLEAALMEYRAPFAINAKTLTRLADTDVPNPVIDLMVALSFPDKFVIERDAVEPITRTDSAQSAKDDDYPIPLSVYYSIVDPYFPWYWTPYTYSLYWNSGWNIWPGYYYVYPGSGGFPVVPDRRGSGLLVNGHGYTRVFPKDGAYAQPRYSLERDGSARGGYGPRSQSSGPAYSGSRGSATYSGGGSYSGGSASAPSGGGASSAPSPAPAPGGGGSGSASPAGYSSDGGSGRYATPR
jgi:hypothetical protein